MVRAILALMLLVSLSAPAQAGFRASAFAYPVFSFLSVSSDPTVGRPALGWGLGSSLEWGPTRWLGLELSFLYTNRAVSGPLSSQSAFIYAQVPFLIRFWPWRFVSLGVGGYVGYALGRVTSTVAGTATELTYTSLGYNRWDWGAAGVLGFQIPIHRIWYVFVDGRMLYGLHSIEENASGGSTSSWMDVSVVAGFRLGNF